MSSVDFQLLAPGFWRATSFTDRIKQSIGLSPSVTELLTLQINHLAKGIDQNENILTSKIHRATIKLVVTYFEEHPDSKLERVLKKLFETAIPEIQTQILDAFTEATLSTGSFKTLSVIQRIVTLEFLKQKCKIENVYEVAKMESVAVPKSIREKAQLLLKGESSQSLNLYRIFKTVLMFPQKVEIYIIKTLITAVHNSIYAETITIKTVKENFDFYRLGIKVSSFLITTFFASFSSYKKTTGFVALIVTVSFIYSSFLIYTFDPELPEYLDKKKYFTNVNVEIQGKKIKGEKTENYRRIITSYFKGLSTKKESLPLVLISSDDAGITNLIRSLAWESQNISHSSIYGMSVYNVKSTALDLEKSKKLDQTLKTLEQNKSRVILHIDARSQTKSSEKIDYFLRELIKNRIPFILTLKQDIFQLLYRAISPTVVNFQAPPLSPEQSELKLRMQIDKSNSEMVEVDKSTYKSLMDSIDEEESSPRQSCTEAVQHVIREIESWVPSNLKKKLQVLQTRKDSLVINARENLRRGSKWSQSPEGREILERTEELETEIETLEKARKKQDLQLQKIIALRRIEFPFNQDYYLYTALIANSPPDSPAQEMFQKSYLFIQHFVKEKLIELVQRRIHNFEKKYKEKIPLKIDGSMLSDDFLPTPIQV